MYTTDSCLHVHPPIDLPNFPRSSLNGLVSANAKQNHAKSMNIILEFDGIL